MTHAKLCLLMIVFFAAGGAPSARAGEVKADHYAFVKDFELVSASQLGPYLRIELSHPAVIEGRAKFQLVPGKACIGDAPPQCSATVVRMDNSEGHAEGLREVSTLTIDPTNYFDVSSGKIAVQVHGPNRHASVVWVSEE